MSTRFGYGECRPEVAVIVATLGTSPYLEDAFAAISQQREDVFLELTVVSQGKFAVEEFLMLDSSADHHVSFSNPLGFAAANNAGLKEILADRKSVPEFIALVNDDAIVERGWLAKLVDVLRAHPEAAAAQGINLHLDADPSREHVPAASSQDWVIDGAGIRWNQRLQAVQVDHGHSVSLPTEHLPTRSRSPNQTRPSSDRGPYNQALIPVFGVSATAALFRTRALQSVALQLTTSLSTVQQTARHLIFDEELDTYYEDVDLACRLHQADWQSLVVPNAYCYHAASQSAPSRRNRLLVANRHLVLARHLGRSYLPKVPGLLLRDVMDFRLTALSGWARAAARMPKFLNLQAPLCLRCPDITPLT